MKQLKTNENLQSEACRQFCMLRNIVLEAFAPGRLTCCFWYRGYSVKVGCNILLCALVEFGAKLLVELNGILCNKCCVLAYLQFAL